MFIELIMDPTDAPADRITGGHASADLDYGLRGSQHRMDAQIGLHEPPTGPNISADVARTTASIQHRPVGGGTRMNKWTTPISVRP
ncbi:MAG: hypothetical protein QOD36_2668 [Mycobacterium sp.]|nr:hypothetical protein [Mycobacterium sp.]